MCANPDLVERTYDLSTLEVETGSEALQGNEFEVSLSYKRPCLKMGKMKLHPDLATELTDMTHTTEFSVTPGPTRCCYLM